jgi:hypothetical protein
MSEPRILKPRMPEARTPELRTSELRTSGPRRTRWAGRIILALLAALLGGAFVGQAASAAEPPVPEDVTAYFATGLVPRLADLYGSGAGTDAAFDETTKVGTIHRLLAWTPDFLAGKKTDAPTQLTNTWIAPVTAKSGTILGLAAVWINPGSDVVELADFSRGSALVDALGRAPKDTLLIDDAVQQAWFATDGKTLTPLVVGTSKTTASLTPAEYQTLLRTKAAPAAPSQTTTNPGLLIAGITLGVVVVLLAVFILLPGRKRPNGAADAADADASVPESTLAEPVEATPTAARPKRPFEPDPEPGASSPKPRKAASRKAAPAKPTVTSIAVAEPVEAKPTPARATAPKKPPTKTAAASTTAAKAAPKKSTPKKKAPTAPPPSAAK